ncbi:MAG: uracil phosphoribosyltransferase, partial [Pseudomonadota bacterium]|nr:uracil phosphoribosyltransferase [Pseudomonadota bacterium]
MSNTLHVVDHPLVTDKLSQLRSVGTDMARFRSLMHDVSFMLGYEALRDWPMIRQPVETPLMTFDAP